MFVILNPSLCHSERSEESSFFAQDKPCEESNKINELKMEILRLLPQNDIMTQSRRIVGIIFSPLPIGYKEPIFPCFHWTPPSVSCLYLFGVSNVLG